MTTAGACRVMSAAVSRTRRRTSAAREDLEQAHDRDLVEREEARETLGDHLLAADAGEAHRPPGLGPESRHQARAELVPGWLAGDQVDERRRRHPVPASSRLAWQIPRCDGARMKATTSATHGDAAYCSATRAMRSAIVPSGANSSW